MFKLKRIVNGLSSFVGRDMAMQFVFFFSLLIHGLLSDIRLELPLSEQDIGPLKIIFINILLNFVSIESIPNLAASFWAMCQQFLLARLITRRFEDLPAIYNFYNHITVSYSFGAKAAAVVAAKESYKKTKKTSAASKIQQVRVQKDCSN